MNISCILFIRYSFFFFAKGKRLYEESDRRKNKRKIFANFYISLEMNIFLLVFIDFL